MSLVVTCPGCNKPTPAGKLLCIHCGAKMQGVTATELAGRSKNQGPGAKARAGSFFSALSRLAVIVVLLGIIGLILWPVEPTGTVPSEKEEVTKRAQRVQNSLTALHDATTAGRGQVAGFSEEDINSHLKVLLDNNADVADGSGATMGVTDVRTDLAANGTFTTVLVSSIGPVDLTWELKHRMEARGGRIRVKSEGGRLGHLPMPGPLADFVKNKVGGFFSALSEEKKIWNNTADFAVEKRAGESMVLIRVGE